MRKLLAIGALWMAGTQITFSADENVHGFLCCNVYTDGESISDINFGGEGMHLIPLGAPIRTTKLKKHRMDVVVENKNVKFDNDYSRDMAIEQFASRWIVAEDPGAKVKALPKNVQAAIAAGRLVLGMTREQTLMALGYPASSEVPNLNAKTWTYWYTSKVQYRVRFDDQDRLVDVEPVVDVKALLLER